MFSMGEILIPFEMFVIDIEISSRVYNVLSHHLIKIGMKFRRGLASEP